MNISRSDEKAYGVQLTPKAKKDLDDISEPDFSRLRTRILALEREPRPMGVKKIVMSHFYRIRVGDWRVLYEISESAKTVIVARVLRRSEKTYRDF